MCRHNLSIDSLLRFPHLLMANNGCYTRAAIDTAIEAPAPLREGIDSTLHRIECLAY